MTIDPIIRQTIIETAEMFKSSQATIFNGTHSGKKAAKAYISQLPAKERRCLLEILKVSKSGLPKNGLKYEALTPSLIATMENIKKPDYQLRKVGLLGRISHTAKTIVGITPSSKQLLKEICPSAHFFLQEDAKDFARLQIENLNKNLNELSVSDEEIVEYFSSYSTDPAFAAPLDFSPEYSYFGLKENCSMKQLEKAYIIKCNNEPESIHSETITDNFLILGLLKSMEKNFFSDSSEQKSLKAAFDHYYTRLETSPNDRADLFKLTQIFDRKKAEKAL